jgi:hypothetical protein
MSWCHVPGTDFPPAQAEEAWIWASCWTNKAAASHSMPAPFFGAFDAVLAGYPFLPRAVAHAWGFLAAAHGLGPVDLAAGGWSGEAQSR